MMDESSAEWLQLMGLLCGDGPGLTAFKSADANEITKGEK